MLGVLEKKKEVHSRCAKYPKRKSNVTTLPLLRSFEWLSSQWSSLLSLGFVQQWAMQREAIPLQQS
jgi:hypothetical protein